MIVELRQQLAGINANGEQQYFEQDQIIVDGRLAGYLAHHEGAPICLIRKFDDDQIAEIERQIGGDPGRIKKVPDVPIEMLKKLEEEGIDDDDLE